ncbi:hypothetical protein Cgig2_031593 [Carnegiea gigantea]|uniref:Uncharacterized protein n=1 Tax=Carnegiea gigantea TaxID=171969 RepID=A0A9Q1QFV0_9CARY|nr:hypothetical protein Cgig2_031593 [Carnegiea gigantea]
MGLGPSRSPKESSGSNKGLPTSDDEDEQARAAVSPFESGSTTSEEVTAEDLLMLRGQKPLTVSLSLPRSVVRKHPRPEEGEEVAATSVPTLVRTGPLPSKGAEAEQVDPPIKLELVDRLARSWDLALSNLAEPPRVIEEHVAIAALEEAHIKIKDKMITSHKGAVKVERQGYQRGQEDRTEFFREFLEMLTPNDFQQEGYLEAYIIYVDDHCRAQASGEDPEQVEF